MDPINLVIDLSHHNQADIGVVGEGGIAGVIHKATGGTGFQDSKYQARREAAQSAGLLWGAYHFGTDADGAEQAEFFLHTVDPTDSVLLVLDFEANWLAKTSMSLDQARDFVTRIHDITGRWPGLYAGGYLKAQLGNNLDPVLANCWLWLAQYSAQPTVPRNWPSWTLWQYTDTGAVPGVTGNCDRDRFNGTQEQLTAFWKTQSVYLVMTKTAGSNN